jgi:hypothetical protein
MELAFTPAVKTNRTEFDLHLIRMWLLSLGFPDQE